MSGTTIPTVPVLPAGYVGQLSDMTALTACCNFLLSKPVCRIIDNTGGQAIGTGATAVNFSVASFDPDGIWSVSTPSRLTIQTPGWYKARYGVNGTVGSGPYTGWLTSTTGANNPLGSGVNGGPFWASYSDTATGVTGWAAAGGLWPAYLYAGDYIQVQITCQATGSSTGTTGPAGETLGGSYVSLEYVSTT